MIQTLQLLAFCLSIGFIGCMKNPPTAADGSATLVILTRWDTTAGLAKPVYMPMPNAKITLGSEYGISMRQADGFGTLIVSALPTSIYSITVRAPHPVDPNIIIVGSISGLMVGAQATIVDTIFGSPISSSGISINEIYAVGPVNNFFYFFDQFIELYNASDEVKYVDGMIIMRVSGNNEGLGPGADEGNDGDIDGVTYAFKFPGSPGEKNHPFYPKQFLVLAVDAVDHRKSISTSYDLSNANWEFYNQFSAEDIDNPSVSNLINIRSDRTVDFLYGLTGDVIVLASGKDSSWVDGIDISTVVDAVEYQSSPHPTNKKTLDSRIDRSYVLSPPRYSGQSMQRREPGLDTNDGLVDFEIIPRATPGKQK
ncbi:MAG: DUF4876 domain-containing protein [bacterium]